jgi:CubicO group peptidase (beta-lactamase class C family)
MRVPGFMRFHQHHETVRMSDTLTDQIHRIVDRHAGPLVHADGPPSASQAPGGIVGVYLGGRSHFFSYGTINPEGDAPNRETLFGLGSVTKTFTTAILGQRPHLLDHSVRGNLPPAFRLDWPEQPTFGQLASFVGGINPDTPPGVTNQEEFVAFINAIPYPGGLPAPWNYSDSSIGLLGQTLMGLDGFPTFDALPTLEWYTQHLFGALGMRWTLPAPVHHALLATPYDLPEGATAYRPIQYAPWVPWGTAGRMFSTADDMVRFIMAAVGVTTIHGLAVPPRITEGIARALQPRATSAPYTCDTVTTTQQACAWLAWPPDPENGSVICGKDGGLPGVSSYLAVNPALQYGIILMTNMAGIRVKCPAVAIMRDLMPLATPPS